MTVNAAKMAVNKKFASRVPKAKASAGKGKACPTCGKMM